MIYTLLYVKFVPSKGIALRRLDDTRIMEARPAQKDAAQSNLSKKCCFKRLAYYW